MEVVLVADGLKDALPTRLTLTEMGYSVLTVWGERSAAAATEDLRFARLAVVCGQCTGQALLERVRHIAQARPGIPILVVAAGLDLERYEALLAAGATQVLIEPVSDELLRSYVEALVPQVAAEAQPNEHRVEVHLRPAAGTARLNGRELRLSPTEVALLLALARVQGQPVSRRELAAAVPGRNEPGTSNAIDVYVARLRAKLSTACIRTIRGGGYMLEKRVVLTTEDTPPRAAIKG